MWKNRNLLYVSDPSMMDKFKEEACVEKGKYISKCEKYGLPIVTAYADHITKQKVCLARRGINEKALLGVINNLKQNIQITEVDLTGNSLGFSATLFTRLFPYDTVLKRLDLSENKIGNEGVRYLLRSIEESNWLIYLSISDNNINDNALKYIGRFLTKNQTLKELDLSKNCLGELSNDELMIGIENNHSLLNLDLSWNHIRPASFASIAHALRKNKTLRKLNLAWNGIDDAGAHVLGKVLSRNNELVELDLSATRITSKGGLSLAEGLMENVSLERVILKNNLLRPSGIQAILESCLKNKRSNIRQVDFGRENVNQENEIIIQKIKYNKPEFVAIYGFRINTNERVLRTNVDQLLQESIGVFNRHLVSTNMRALDLFNSWDKEKLYVMQRDEFRRGMNRTLPQFDEQQVDILISWLDPGTTNQIDYKDFVRLLATESQHRMSLAEYITGVDS